MMSSENTADWIVELKEGKIKKKHSYSVTTRLFGGSRDFTYKRDISLIFQNINTGKILKRNYPASHRSKTEDEWGAKEQWAGKITRIILDFFRKLDKSKPSLDILPIIKNGDVTSLPFIEFNILAKDNKEIETIELLHNDRKIKSENYDHQTEAELSVSVPLNFGVNKIKIVGADWIGKKVTKEFSIVRVRSGNSEKIAGKKIRGRTTPKLDFSVYTIDTDSDGIFEGGETVGIIVSVRNTGEGIAKLVKVRITGDKKFIEFTGPSRKIGNIKPGETKEVTFKTSLPTEISPKEAKIYIEVKEGRGYSPAKKIEKLIAMVPKEIAVVTALPGLEPVPNTYRRNNSDAYAIVVGINNYPSVNKLRFARQDAEIMAKYIYSTMGVPKNNIRTLYDENATKSRIEATVKSWLGPKSPKTVIFYYSGHGSPNPTDLKEPHAYLIPYDGDMDLGIGTMVSINELIKSIEDMNAKKIVFILDACFSPSCDQSFSWTYSYISFISIQPFLFLSDIPSFIP